MPLSCRSKPKIANFLFHPWNKLSRSHATAPKINAVYDLRPAASDFCLCSTLEQNWNKNALFEAKRDTFFTENHFCPRQFRQKIGSFRIKNDLFASKYEAFALKLEPFDTKSAPIDWFYALAITREIGVISNPWFFTRTISPLDSHPAEQKLPARVAHLQSHNLESKFGG